MSDDPSTLIKRLHAEIAELRDLIEECEWVAPSEADDGGWCPWCGFSSHNNRTKKHKPGCRIAAAIKGEAGRDYLAPADVRVLVNPMGDVITEVAECRIFNPESMDRETVTEERVRKAIDYMREKGLCE